VLTVRWEPCHIAVYWVRVFEQHDTEAQRLNFNHELLIL